MLSNYNQYDYKKEFWDSGMREYEHRIEFNLIQRLLTKNKIRQAHIADIGCGFGRLFPAYEPFANSFTLVDYSSSMLDQARSTIKTKCPIEFIEGNALQLPIKDHQMDVTISIRTLHHLQEYETFFASLYRITKPNGLVIFEIPNYRHIKNIIRYMLLNGPSPFKKTISQLGDRFVNYHPSLIYDALPSAGLQLIQKVNLSFFRSTFFKDTIPTNYLVRLDEWAQSSLSWTDLTPSIYCVCKTMLASSNKNSDKSAGYIMPTLA